MTDAQLDKLITITQGLVFTRDEFMAGLWHRLSPDERTLIAAKLDSAIERLKTIIMLEEALMTGRGEQ